MDTWPVPSPDAGSAVNWGLSVETVQGTSEVTVKLADVSSAFASRDSALTLNSLYLTGSTSLSEPFWTTSKLVMEMSISLSMTLRRAARATAEVLALTLTVTTLSATEQLSQSAVLGTDTVNAGLRCTMAVRVAPSAGRRSEVESSTLALLPAYSFASSSGLTFGLQANAIMAQASMLKYFFIFVIC